MACLLPHVPAVTSFWKSGSVGTSRRVLDALWNSVCHVVVIMRQPEHRCLSFGVCHDFQQRPHFASPVAIALHIIYIFTRLGEEPASEQELLALLKPCPDEALKIWPVDRMVGNVRNNGPQLILPVLSNIVPHKSRGESRRISLSCHNCFVTKRVCRRLSHGATRCGLA